MAENIPKKEQESQDASSIKKKKKEKGKSFLETIREIDAKEAEQEAEREEQYRRLLQEKEEREKEAYAQKIREDRIELIRLKQGMIQESDRIYEQKEEKQKRSVWNRIFNFFYHNKWWLGITCVLAILFGYLIIDYVTKVRPDFSVMVLTDNIELQNRTQELETYFSQFIEDENGDGKKKVSIYYIPVTDNMIDMDYYTGNATKLSTQLQLGEVVMVLTDTKANAYINAEDTLVNLSELYPDDEHIREYGYYLRYTDFATKIGYPGRVDRDLSIGLRIPTKTYDSLEEMQEHYAIAEDVLQQVIADLEGTEPPAELPKTEFVSGQVETTLMKEES